MCQNVTRNVPFSITFNVTRNVPFNVTFNVTRNVPFNVTRNVPFNVPFYVTYPNVAGLPAPDAREKSGTDAGRSQR